MKSDRKTIVGITALCAALGGAAPLYAAEENQRSFERAGEVIDNSVVTGKVKTALLRDSEVKGLDISVVSRDGEVILAGSAESRRQADRAAKIAQGVKGVKKVTNKIVVKGDDTGKPG